MKKKIILFCVAMSLFATNVFAQEVRGIETRLAEYEGDSYEYYAYSHGNARNESRYNFSTYYGFELTNKNSISVSVSVEIYLRGSKEDKLVATKEVVLASGESYIMKQPRLEKYTRYEKPGEYDSVCIYSDLEKNGKNCADYYYVRYKAYKLQ